MLARYGFKFHIQFAVQDYYLLEHNKCALLQYAADCGKGRSLVAGMQVAFAIVTVFSLIVNILCVCVESCILKLGEHRAECVKLILTSACVNASYSLLSEFLFCRRQSDDNLILIN